MSKAEGSPRPDFIIDCSRVPPYPLAISDQPTVQQFIRNIPLHNIRWEALQELVHPESDSTTLRASLLPSNDARTIAVMVGTTLVGTVPDPAVIFNSQIARVYASGFVPTCQLQITPNASVAASISLYASDGGVPFNDPPTNQWTLLPSGRMWRVEPTRLSPFHKIPDQSRVLVELRAIDDMVFIHLNGVECGILDMDAADALKGAVDTATESGLLALARGWVDRGNDGHVALHINASNIRDWDSRDFQLPRNPLATLVPHRDDPEDYHQEMQRFIHEHRSAQSRAETHPARVHGWLGKTGPALLLLLAVLGIIPVFLFESVSARGLVGIFGVSIVLCVISLWVLACRQRDTDHCHQPRHWNTVAPLALTALIPSLVFATIGVFHDAGPQLSTTTSSVHMTTLQTYPRDGGVPLSEILERNDDGSLPQPTRSQFSQMPTPVQEPPAVATTPRTAPPAVLPRENITVPMAPSRSPDPTPLPRPTPQNVTSDTDYQPPVPELPAPREPSAPPANPQAPQAPQLPLRPEIFDIELIEDPPVPLWPTDPPPESTAPPTTSETPDDAPDDATETYGDSVPGATDEPAERAVEESATTEPLDDTPEEENNKDLNQPEEAGASPLTVEQGEG